MLRALVEGRSGVVNRDRSWEDSCDVAELLLRRMTEAEFDEFFAHSIRSYADAHVAAGNWSREGAEERAAAAGARLLPAGFATENMLFLMAEAAGEVVG